jgi:hypothetical protein
MDRQGNASREGKAGLATVENAIAAGPHEGTSTDASDSKRSLALGSPVRPCH